MPKKPAFDAALVALAVVALFAGVYYFRDTFPLPGNRGELPKEAVIERCQSLLDSLGIEVDNLEQEITLESNQELLSYAQATFGTATANHLFANDLPAYFWKIRFARPFGLKELFKISSSDEKETEETVRKMVAGETTVDFDLMGRLLRFTTGFDSAGAQTRGDSTTVMSRVRVARRFSAFADEDALEPPRLERTSGARFNDFRIDWKSRIAAAGVTPSITAKVRSDKLTFWEAAYSPSQKISGSGKSVHNLLAPFIYFGVILSLVVFFFRKLRADRMSFRAGLPGGIVCAVAGILPSLFSTTGNSIERFAPIIFLPLFYVLGFMLIYAVSESVMRDTGSDRLRAFEALQHRHFFFKSIGDSLWYGATFGALGFGLAVVALHYFGAAAKYYARSPLFENHPYLSYAPALSLLGTAFSNVVFGEVTFRLFAVSFFQRYFRSWGLPVVLSALVAAAAKMHLVWLHPLGMMLGVNFLISLLLSVAYVRFDFLSSVIAALTVQVLYLGMSLFYVPGVYSAFQASLLLAIPLLFLIGSEVVRRYGSDKIDTRELEPDYVQRFAERERMARELEIARQVQASFLPHEKPQIKGLDIASLCVPAQEVGGDYYDFIAFSPTRLGVLVGDVSGKGISAAFYMTLTKGIVKTLVHEGLTPAEVLIRANQHFYDNAERGIFVSLVFGVFDLQSKEFTFARAGHNPVIIASSLDAAPRTFSPPGIALGLEPGEIFARKIVEKTVPIAPGDLFVFYTDGFTEAMNNGKEEFGEPRFEELVHGLSKEPSALVVDRLQGEVKKFAGQVPQHDDMTAIVVKVL
jgi:sigma-B regulation protein RsbU (phosphoserine phosphatase)